jgi:hypothetical protein
MAIDLTVDNGKTDNPKSLHYYRNSEQKQESIDKMKTYFKAHEQIFKNY